MRHIGGESARHLTNVQSGNWDWGFPCFPSVRRATVTGPRDLACTGYDALLPLRHCGILSSTRCSGYRDLGISTICPKNSKIRKKAALVVQKRQRLEPAYTTHVYVGMHF
eukprot:3454927-Rhodomonas_salina.2